jgi:photosystem II stability/assembly factor-like uncharacterized protein
MFRSPLVPLVLLLSFLAVAAHALQFFPATPAGQPGHPAVTAVAVSASAPHVVYAAAGGKLFRSYDAGRTWSMLAVPSSTIAQLAVDPVQSAIVYFVALGRIFRSDDSGATWKDVSASGESVLAPLRIDPQDPSTLYLGARCNAYGSPLEGGGVYKSADRGESWVRLGTKVKCVDFMAFDPAATQRIFAGTATGVDYRTDDAGRTWRQGEGELPVFDVVVDVSDPSRRYGLGRGPAGDGFVHFVISTDAGATWSRVAAEGLPPGGQQLVIDPATRRLFLLGQSFGLYVSDDLGLHWRHIDAVPVLRATPLTMAAADDVIYVATPGGLYRVPMSDPDSPTAIHPGEPAPLRVLVDRIALDPRDAATLYATAYEGPGVLNAYRVFRSTDSGRSWQRITGEDDTERRVLLAVDASGDLYGLSTEIVWRFARDTQTWERWNVPLLFYPTIFVANPQRAGWLYAATSGWAAHSTDGGRTWVRISSVVSGFWSLSIAPNGSDLVGGNSEGTFASSDGGVTWRALPGARLETRAVAIAPSRPETIYRLSNTAGGGLLAGLFRSDDGGETWMALRWPGERDTAMATTSIAVDPRDHRSLWIGLAHSSDGGVTWTIEPSSAPVPMYSVVFDRDGAVLYGLGRDLSIWKTIVRGGRRRAARP